MSRHVYVVEVAFRDGRRAHPAMIREGSPDWQRRLDEAVEHFEEQHAGEATVTVHYGRDLASMGVGEPERVQEWK